MQNEILNIDLDSLYIETSGLTHNKKAIDYAIIKDHNGRGIWYDADCGIQIKWYDDSNDTNHHISLDTTNKTLLFNAYQIGESAFYKKYSTEIPIQYYTEESFFMESTMHDFGTVSFENYQEVIRIYDKVLFVINTKINEVTNAK